MKKLTVYGLPLAPRSAFDQLAGGSFCVSFATRKDLGRQLEDAIRLVGQDQILLVDNGAFSYHKAGGDTRSEAYLDAFEEWAGDILERCPQAVAVIPDVIGGTEAENAELAAQCQLDPDRCMAVWHLHERLDLHLERLEQARRERLAAERAAVADPSISVETSIDVSSNPETSTLQEAA